MRILLTAVLMLWLSVSGARLAVANATRPMSVYLRELTLVIHQLPEHQTRVELYLYPAAELDPGKPVRWIPRALHKKVGEFTYTNYMEKGGMGIDVPGEYELDTPTYTYRVYIRPWVIRVDCDAWSASIDPQVCSPKKGCVRVEQDGFVTVYRENLNDLPLNRYNNLGELRVDGGEIINTRAIYRFAYDRLEKNLATVDPPTKSIIHRLRPPASDPTVSYIIYAHALRYVLVPDYERFDPNGTTIPARLYVFQPAWWSDTYHTQNAGWIPIQNLSLGQDVRFPDKYGPIGLKSDRLGYRCELYMQLPEVMVRVTIRGTTREYRWNVYRDGVYDPYNRIVSVYNPEFNTAPLPMSSGDPKVRDVTFNGGELLWKWKEEEYQIPEQMQTMAFLFLTAVMVMTPLPDEEAAFAVPGFAGMRSAAAAQAAIRPTMGAFSLFESRLAGNTLFGGLAGRTISSPSIFGGTARYLVGGDGMIRTAGPLGQNIVGSIAADGTVYRGAVPFFRTPAFRVMPNGEMVRSHPLGGNTLGRIRPDGSIISRSGKLIGHAK